MHTSTATDDALAELRPTRRYSLRDLLALTAAVAVGFALGRLPEFGIVDGLFATASLLVLIGHPRQARLQKTVTQEKELDPDINLSMVLVLRVILSWHRLILKQMMAMR